MVEKKVTIKNKFGLHLRAAALFVKTSSLFKSEIKVLRNQMAVNGKSILGLMMIGAGPGCEIIIKAEGEDEGEVLVALSELVVNKFNE